MCTNVVCVYVCVRVHVCVSCIGLGDAKFISLVNILIVNIIAISAELTVTLLQALKL